MAELLPKLKILLKIWAGKLELALLNFVPDPEITPDERPMNAPDAPETSKIDPGTTQDFITHFATCIRDYEGKPGDLNYKNNNPGNFRCPKVAIDKRYGDVQCVDCGPSGKFLKFPTYELGWLYLTTILKQRIKANPTWSCRDFFRNYAPTGDNNNPDRYAAYVAARLAISVDYPLSKCLS